MNDKLSANETLNLLLINQQHIHENIKFEDQKATAFIGLNAALLGVIYKLIDLDISNPATVVLGSFACLSLAVGTGFAIWVIKPRGRRNKKRGGGVIDSIRIAQLSLQDYLWRIQNISNEGLIEELRTFIFDRAKIDREKYNHLTFSLVFSVAGWLFALIASVLVKAQI